MTCKDNCLHYEVCLTAFSSKGMYLGDDAEKMECFKNKADFVEVKHGEWKYYSTTMMECSVCKRHTPRHRYEFCPHCGAKMDGGKKQ